MFIILKDFLPFFLCFLLPCHFFLVQFCPFHHCQTWRCHSIANLARLCAELIIFFAGEWIICYICGKILTFTTMQENEGKYIFGVVKVGDKGQIVIPKEARTVYNIKPGDALLMLGDQKGMALLKTDIFQSVIDQTMEGLTK